MAKPVRPGVGKREAAKEAASTVVEIAFRGESHKLAINLIPLREKLAFLRETGFDFEELTFREQVYSTSIAPLVWLSRRAHGEPSLTFAAFSDEWPTDMSMGEVTVTVDRPDDEDADPEA
jgi:hypothetical protein